MRKYTMQELTIKNYTDAIQAIKNAILKSRYRAAALANRELLSLYYGIGKYISENSRTGFWGTGAIDTISQKLQQELPGLRGFSVSNMKNMRMFYEEWREYFENRTSLMHNLELSVNQIVENQILPMDEFRQPAAGEMGFSFQEINIQSFSLIRPLTAGELAEEQIKLFLSIGFTHHCEILAKTQ